MYDLYKEEQEAIMAGEKALQSLKNAKGQLDSARNWGIFDILGGGLISGLVKRSKVRNSQDYMVQAKEDLNRFAVELQDVQVYRMDIDIEIDDFIGYADLLWDNIFVDWMMQDRINEARSKLDDVIRKVEQILMDLRREN